MRESRRETCIWESPTWAAISVCVIPPKNRSSRIRRSRSGSAASSGCDALPVLDQVELRLGRPERGGEPGPVPRAALVVTPPRLVQRGSVGGTLGRQPFQDDLEVQFEVTGHLTRSGSAAVALGEFGRGVAHSRLQLP